MSDNRRQTRRISSILKNAATSDESPTQTFSRRSKRISFSHVNNVKEFRADDNNHTIWGDSYEKSTAKNLSNSGSVSQIQTIDSVAATTTAASHSVAVASTIDLFADIEDGSDEMEISFGDSQSGTIFDQTMFIEETVTTSATSCKLMNMFEVVGSTNKRKTIEPNSAGTTTLDATKSVKIRKMNDENVEPEMHHTILHHVNMSVTQPDRNSVTKCQVNLNTTRIFEGDADISDVSLPQIMLPNKSVPSTQIGWSKQLDNRMNAVDISVDEPSMTSVVSETSLPASHKTRIYGSGDISAGIDQTFAVRNPLHENNANVWNAVDKLDDSKKPTFGDHEMAASVPLFQLSSGNSRHRTLEDLTISMDIQFQNHSLSQHTLNADEPAIEDLTIFLDTNFKAEVSGENEDSAIESVSKLSGLTSSSDTSTNNSCLGTEEQKTETVSCHEPPATVLPATDNRENAFANGSVQHSHRQDLTNLISEDLALDPIRNAACREKTLLSIPDPLILYDSSNEKLAKPKFMDHSTSHDQVAMTDFSFAYSEPLSSTRFIPNNKPNLCNSDTKNKANCSSVTFNYCPTLTATRQSQDLRSATSLQNNTDELCNLEPDQLKKRSEAKNMFLSLSQHASIEMLSDTKMDLISISDSESVGDQPRESGTNDPPMMNATSAEAVAAKSIYAATEMKTNKEPRCLKCMNCRASLGGDSDTFAGISMGQLNERPKLDFSIYDQFKGLPTLRDAIEMRKKKEAATELENQLLVDRNVVAPDIRLLWYNKISERNAEPQPVYVPEPLICLPLRMDIQYLMRNKMRTEYPQWKYVDNFFHIGALKLRYNEIPSIVIHIKFDENAPKKSEELNMPLLFNRVFLEQCQTYLNRISTGNQLKHNHAYGLLPANLLSLLSSSENIYRGLDEIGKRFRSVVVKVNEFDALTVEHDALVRMDSDGTTCYVEKTIFDIQKQLAQSFTIEFDKVDVVGPDQVHFDPDCQTNDAFKALPSGLPFLRSFLSEPMSYIVPITDV